MSRLIEQEGVGAAPIAGVQSFMSAGGRVILSGSSSNHAAFMNSLFGTSLSTASTGSGSLLFGKTAAAAGTTFADDAANLAQLSSTHYITGGTLPSGSTVFYSGAGAQVFHSTFGAGDFFYIGWDYCCAGTSAQRNDYYGVLDSAINYAGAAAVPEPLTAGLFGIGLLGMALSRRRPQAAQALA